MNAVVPPHGFRATTISSAGTAGPAAVRAAAWDDWGGKKQEGEGDRRGGVVSNRIGMDDVMGI